MLVGIEDACVYVGADHVTAVAITMIEVLLPTRWEAEALLLNLLDMLYLH